MANVKNNSTVLSLNLKNVNCLSADGILREIKAELGCPNLKRDLVVGLVDMNNRTKDIMKLQPKVSLVDGELKIEELNCKTAHGTVKEVKARAPKFLNASKGTTKPSREPAVFGRNR